MALAPLGFTVDTTPVAKAIGDLERLSAATAKADSVTKQVSSGTNAAAASTRQLGSATAAAATQMTIATNAVRANNAALQITNQQGAAAQHQMQNLALQFQDIGTMLLSGQSPFTLLAQQLPQLTQNGGRLTGVMGALRQSLANVFSPLGLLTTGFVIAASAAMDYFTSAGDEADKASEALEEQISLARRVADRWGDAIPAVRAYADELERVRDLEDLQAQGKKMAEDLYAPLQQAAADLRIEMVDFVDQLRDNAPPDVINDLQDAFNDLQRKVADNKATVEDAQTAQKALNTAMSVGVGDATSLQDALSDLIPVLKEVAGEAAKTGAKIADIEARGGIPRSEFGGGRGSDPRDIETDEYWRGRYFPDPETPSRQPRTRRSRQSEAEREAERAKEAYDDMLRQSEQFVAAQMLERDALYMTEEAANALRYEQELLNQAANDNIKLTPEMAAELRSYAQAMAQAEAETARLQEAMEFAKDLTRNFIDDFRYGMEQGKGIWESFADAALNALDQIVDKLLGDVLDAIFEINSAGSGGGTGGGVLGFLGGLLGGGGGGPLTNLPLGVGLYDQGGYTGPGGKYEPAGVVHKGEYVFSAAATQALGVASLERLHRRGKGYAEGGPVATAVPHMQAPANSNPPAYAPVYQIDASGSEAGVEEKIRRVLKDHDRQSYSRFLKDWVEANKRGALG